MVIQASQGGGRGWLLFPGPGSHPAFHCLQYEICSKTELGLRMLAKHIHVHVCMIRVWRDGLIRVRIRVSIQTSYKHGIPRGRTLVKAAVICSKRDMGVVRG